MKLVCTMPVRNEAWCLGLTLRAALMVCDEVVVLNHASTDRTQEIIEKVSSEEPGRVWYLKDENPVWEECRQRQAMLDCARARDATHIALIDADEILTSNFINDESWLFRKVVERSCPGILTLPWICLARSTWNRYTEGTWGRNFCTCAFNDSPEAHWKAIDGYDFHHRHPMGVPPRFQRPMQHHEGGLMHLQFLSERRLKAKQAAYKMQEVLRWPNRESPLVVNARYNPAVYDSLIETQPTAPVPEEWWSAYRHLMKYLDIDAEPWQEKQCKVWMAEYGAKRFEGLDLFGVV